MRKKNVAIMIPSLTGGGAERAAGNLSIELSKYCNVVFFLDAGRAITYDYAGKIIVLGNPKSRFWDFIYRKACALKNIYCAIFSRPPINVPSVLTKIYKRYYRIGCAISFLDGPNFQNIRTAQGEKVIVTVHNTESMAEKYSNAKEI